jgi:hypothetical protein
LLVPRVPGSGCQRDTRSPGELGACTKGKVSAPSSEWRAAASAWGMIVCQVMDCIPRYRVLVKEPRRWNWATPDHRLPQQLRLGRKPAGVEIASGSRPGVSLQARSWWNTLDERVRDLFLTRGLRSPARASWVHRQRLVGNVDWVFFFSQLSPLFPCLFLPFPSSQLSLSRHPSTDVVLAAVVVD